VYCLNESLSVIRSVYENDNSEIIGASVKTVSVYPLKIKGVSGNLWHLFAIDAAGMNVPPVLRSVNRHRIKGALLLAPVVLLLSAQHSAMQGHVSGLLLNASTVEI
jgi:hypothetical protein